MRSDAPPFHSVCFVQRTSWKQNVTVLIVISIIAIVPLGTRLPW